jgi:hypothetical protein
VLQDKEECQSEIQEFNNKLMRIKDEQMDYEAQTEKKFEQNKLMKEEIVMLKSTIQGKDEAIKALGQNLMEKGKEHEKMSEMVNNFKNKLISENCFHIVFAAFKYKTLNSSTGDEVTLGFIRDRSFDEEFFLVIENKQFNSKTGNKDKFLIPVDDIDEIEHIGQLQFHIHYKEELF